MQFIQFYRFMLPQILEGTSVPLADSVSRSCDKKRNSCDFEQPFVGKILLLWFAILLAICQSCQSWENPCIFGAIPCDFFGEQNSCKLFLQFWVKIASCTFCANFALILRFLRQINWKHCPSPSSLFTNQIYFGSNFLI